MWNSGYGHNNMGCCNERPQCCGCCKKEEKKEFVCKCEEKKDTCNNSYGNWNQQYGHYNY